MRRIIIILTNLLVITSLWAQAPQKMSYQAVIRNSSNALVVSSKVGMRISILQGSATGTAVYTETQTPTTNANGLLSIEIGGQAGFDSINWASGIYFIKTETDPAGGANYAIIGTSQLLSVPFAFYAAKSGNGFSGNFNDLTNKPDLSKFDKDSINELQALSIKGDTIFLSKGGYVKLPTKTIPQVQASAATAMTTVSASVGGSVTADNGNLILMKGICWATTQNPTTSNSLTTEGVGNKPFTSVLTNLLPNTTYYARAYATTVAGTAYSAEISLTTNALSLATLSTNAAYNISNVSAIARGDISNDGGDAITARGLCWGTSANPTISDSKVVSGSGLGTFTASITALSQGTLYYVRAFATNSVGTAYGTQISFTTTFIPLATLNTSAISSISYTSAVSGGEILTDEGNAVTARGLCYGTTANPTTANTVLSSGSGLGSFISVITGLSGNTTYYVRAYATNAGGTTYGTQKTFTTLALTKPTLTSSSIVGISTNSANGGGNITDDGGSAITARGVCWSTSTAPTISNSLSLDGTGAGSYNSIITGLTLNTTYYVRAYATNSSGTAYGQEVSFTTLATIPVNGLPVVGTKSIAKGSTSFTSGGFVSSDGGSVVSARGVCWATTTNPTISDNLSSDSTGIGSYNSSIISLAGCGTTYYVRAYATNSNGTSYGNQLSVASGLLPIVESPVVNSITLSTAIGGGTVTSDGGCAITERGICWSNLPSPTINNSKVVCGATATFSGSLTGLYPNYTYYVRAYAKNSSGVGYSSEVQFTTLAGASGIAIGQMYAGGIVLYLDATGEHGLVCSPNDIGTWAQWGCEGTSIPTSTTLGSGAANTATILANCSQAGIAARICDDLVLNGYTDWFLPSKDELNLIYANLCATQKLSFSAKWYVSSSQYDSNNNYYQSFPDGTHSNWKKNITLMYYVRAVRSF